MLTVTPRVAPNRDEGGGDVEAGPKEAEIQAKEEQEEVDEQEKKKKERNKRRRRW